MLRRFAMPIPQPQFVLAALDSDTITEFLGIVAAGAFLVVALWVLITFLKESTTRQSLLAAQLEAAKVAEQADRASDAQDLFEEEVRKLEEEYRQFFDQTIGLCKSKLGELVANARSAQASIAASYARVARNQDGEHAEVIKERFLKACEAQWSGFKAEVGYVGFQDLEPQLRMVLNAHELIAESAANPAAVAGEIAPGLLRLNEVILLQRGMHSERMGSFQMEAMEAVEPFKRYYNRCVKEWLNDILFNLVQKLREKKARGASIRDTELKSRFVRLRNILETVSRLSDRLESNMQEIGEQDAAFDQIAFGGVVLSVLSQAPQWFPELGDDQAEPSPSGAVASGHENARAHVRSAAR